MASKVLKYLISITLISALVYWLGPAKIYDSFRKVEAIWLIPFFATILFVYFSGAFNLWILINRSFKISYPAFLMQYIYPYFLALFIPGQLGDVSLVVLLKKKHGVPMKSTAAAYTADKLITLVVYVLASSVGIYLYLPHRMRLIIFLLAFVCTIFLSLLIAIKFFPAGYMNTIFGRVRRMLDEIALYRNDFSLVALNLLSTILKWLVMGAGFYFIFRSFGTSIPFISGLTIPVMASFIGYIPISVGGIGTLEALAVYLFSLAEVDKVIVLNVYIFSRISQYLACLPPFLLNQIIKGYYKKVT